MTITHTTCESCHGTGEVSTGHGAGFSACHAVWTECRDCLGYGVIYTSEGVDDDPETGATFQDLLDRETLDAICDAARSASWHRTMADRTRRMGCPREASKHAVSARIAGSRLSRKIAEAQHDGIDTAMIQIVVMEGEAAGVDDADAVIDVETIDLIAG